MLLTKEAHIVWNSRNKKHYVDLGYKFTKMGDSFSVNVDDLTIGSQAIVMVKCDYCGDVFYRKWYSHTGIKRRELVNKDACIECCETKSNDSICEKYGDHRNMFFGSNDKRIKTYLERYGSTNPFSNESVKEKIIKSNIEKYGVSYCQQSKEVRIKSEETCLKRYGVKNYVELFRGKFVKENSPSWKGGVSNSRVERASYEYSLWRKEIFNRDHYTCCKCGSKNGVGIHTELHAHHILNWKDNEHDRYNIDNGITLCDKCHYDFHSKYGKRNNTKDQLDSFLTRETDKKIC